MGWMDALVAEMLHTEFDGPACEQCGQDEQYDEGPLCLDCFGDVEMALALRGHYGAAEQTETRAAIRAGWDYGDGHVDPGYRRECQRLHRIGRNLEQG